MSKTDSELQAFCLNEPSERFINFASFDTGVLAFECIFNSLISDASYSFRVIFLFAAFLATSISNSDPERLHTTIAFIIKRPDANR
jgi:hypothetical protein